MEKRVIVIVGPTASGKSDLAILLAQELNTEIISADSRQFYKSLNIGTAKPTKEELNSVTHHFIDNLEVDENYDVSKYEEQSLAKIKEIHLKNKIPIVVGGSGMYIKALVDGFFSEVGRDEEYRKELLHLQEEKGNEYLHLMLQKVDPISCEKMLPQNWKRVMRALEVFYITGKPIWEFQEEYKRKTDNIFLQYGLDWKREVLYKRIEQRVDQMIELGLVDEVKSLLASGIDKNINSLNTVGYKEIIEFIENRITLERAIELIKRNTRRYAKRQLTWFRKDERIRWFSISVKSELSKISKEIVDSL